MYLILFKHFTVYDQKDASPNIKKLLDKLFVEINDKSSFIVHIF